MTIPVNRLLDTVEWEPLPPMQAKDDELYATHQGFLTIGAARLKCYTLNDGRRLFDAEDVHRFFSGEQREPPGDRP